MRRGAPLGRHGALAAPWVVTVACLAQVLAPTAALADDGTTARSRGAEPSSFFEYLYAEPNSGAASGGHVAIRLGEHVFHFQQVEGGVLRIFRVDAARFDHSYRALGNRTLRVTRVPVAEHTVDELHWAFESYLERQDREFDDLEERRRDQALLGAWSSTAGETRATAVAASGYFDAAAADEGAPGAAAAAARVRRVARRIEERHGAEYLNERAHELALAIERFDDRALGEGIARRYTDLASEWLAIDVLRTAAPLAASGVIEPDDPRWALDEAARERLSAIATTIEDAAVALASSTRSDRGYPLLVALARLQAIERSIASGRLVLLDPARGDEAVLPAADVRDNVVALRRIQVERDADLQAARAALDAPGSWDEGRLSRLELAAAAWAELAHALAAGTSLRVPTTSQVPSKLASERRPMPRPALDGVRIAAARERAAAAETTALASLRARYPYDLVSRNCVTEIFQVLASVPLDGQVDPAGALLFVPLAASHAVDAAYAGSSVEIRPSFRASALDALARCDGSALTTELREGSTLTARSYAPNDADPVFLFFTDDAGPLRPLLGAINLAVAAGGTLAGAATAPWDGGTLLRRGWEGVIFSVPELAWLSLRRGTIPFAPLAWEADWRALCAAPRS